ncbi:MAG: hypothetical protein JWN21_332 [Sphingomonas bacterium]|nr:hypothetical protein [Sphingomonas bacterium]
MGVRAIAKWLNERVSLLVEQVRVSSREVHITGTRSAIEHLLVSDKPVSNGTLPSFDRDWCGREDSNFHVLSDTATSRLRVYQFRHGRTSLAGSLEGSGR